MKQYVVMYSGGVMSYLAAKRVLATVPREQVTLLFCDTKTEDQDLYRFLVETSNILDVPITWLQDGRDIWQVMFDVKLLGNTMMDPCSRVLKRQLVDKYMTKHHRPEHTVRVYGFGWDEEHRAIQLTKRLQPWVCEFPLLSETRLYQSFLDEVEADGIRVPLLYRLGFTHNNCGGFCIKAGKKQFKRLLEVFPARYRYHEEKEQELLTLLGMHGKLGILRHTERGVKRYITLRQYRLMLEQGAMSPDDIEGDVGGCGCFIDDNKGDSMSTTDFGFGTEENYGFDLPSTDETPVAYTVNADHTVTPADTDDFWGSAFDEEAIAAELKADMAPEGEYVGTLGNFEQRMNRFEGYPEVRYYAKLTHANGQTANVSLTLTPKKVYKNVPAGTASDPSVKPRYEYILFKQVREVAKLVLGQYPANGDEFNAFVTGTPLVYRCVHERNGKGLKVMGVRKPAN